MDALFGKGAAETIGRDAVEAALAAKKTLRVKLGIDPTAPDLHLGHAVVLRKLREFQDAGHQAVLVIGDFTATIGDPSGRPGAREPLAKEDVKKNLKRFLAQASLILDEKTLEVRHNSEWFGKMGLRDLMGLVSNFTLQQISERDDFAKRIVQEQPVGLHELMYPILQAYDSCRLDADIELGGLDQRLNLIAGRHLMHKIGVTPQALIMMPLLIGTDGDRKMSKSIGNYVGLTDAPDDMLGKIMSIPDALMPNWFELLTELPMPEDAKPRDAKMLLAKTVVDAFHGAGAGERAEEAFISKFSKKELPTKAADLSVPADAALMEILIAAGTKSKAEAKRLVMQGGVKIDGAAQADPDAKAGFKDGSVLQIGKLKAFTLRIAK